MAFNFERYTSNNPLLQEIEEANQYPLIGIENAVLTAIEAGIDKQTVINIVNQTYGGINEDDYTSAEEFDDMDNDQLDAAGFTGDSDLGPN